MSEKNEKQGLSRSGMGKEDTQDEGIGRSPGDYRRPKKRSPAPNPASRDKGDLQMTPMIDVVFQLLIFFMVGCQFKTFEGKLSAFLPREGLDPKQPPPVVDQEVPLMVHLKWNAPRRQCRVTVGSIFCGYDSEGLQRALVKASRIRQSGVKKAEIDAGGDVRIGWVVQTLNMLIRAGLKEINFTGSPNPLRGS